MTFDYSPDDVLNIDVDGVLALFTDHLLTRIGSDRKHADVSEPEMFALIERWHGTTMMDHAVAALSDPEFWTKQPVIPYAQEAVQLFRDHGLILKFVTKSWPGCENWDAIRRRWLFDHFGVLRSDVVSADDKRLQLAAGFIDDIPEHVTDWSRTHPGKHAFLFDAPYNRPDSTPPFEWPHRVGWGPDLSGARAVLQALGRG